MIIEWLFEEAWDFVSDLFTEGVLHRMDRKEREKLGRDRERVRRELGGEDSGVA
jgi:hypothetical protein